MIKPRVIPALLLKGQGLVKTVKFKEPKYLGDPINIVRIFNDKEVDELVLLDITATPEKRGPQFDLLKNIASEAFIPLAYGGGIRSMDDVKKLLSIGIEKLIMNTSAVETPSLVREVADHAGSQAAVVSMDVKKGLLGKYEVLAHCGQKKTGLDPVKHAVEMERMGVGEILINSIDRDGTMQGYDLELVRKVADAVSVPVVACGGAGNLTHVSEVIKQGHASAAAAGSIFVFQGPLRGVLISYPTPKELKEFI
ncbi:MAG: imidazole glycerol phosphate synthase subunit HisF [Anaerolineales bacterium]|uniref:AglZ/HisF2 family acetamidino modification protein n=1 Tax=Candidatus Villigracilis vicinus TaxID=3140679 RepID=UPI0031351842|nr:imidazole glycerol phosphate synthase subunit HisF [Anaerolineales bacterium]